MTETTRKKRTPRTPDEIIADLEKKIADVKARAAAKEARSAPEGKPFIAAVRAVDKALEAARKAGNEQMATALEAARAPLGTLMVEMGIRLPQRPRRGRGKARAGGGE